MAELSTSISTPVVILGAGMAGLAAATCLHRAGLPVRVLEASDRPGGRLRTDLRDGFRLDHGFQVFLSAYPACRSLLDYSRLDLREIEPGAELRNQGRLLKMPDPFRNPMGAWSALSHPALTLRDKWQVLRLRLRARQMTDAELAAVENISTLEFLRREGFSERSVQQFFGPFLGGVFLDERLSVSARMLHFVWKYFSAGPVVVPAKGIAALPTQLAEELKDQIQLDTRVTALQDGGVVLEGGEIIEASAVIVATEIDTTVQLTGIETKAPAWRGTTNLYFASDQLKRRYPSLLLRGDETDSPLQTATVLSDIAPELAPDGKALISVTASESALELSEDELQKAVQHRLATWLDLAPSSLRHLATYRVPRALPVADLEALEKSPAARDHFAPGNAPLHADSWFLAGDWLQTPSLQGACQSGIHAAEAAKTWLKRRRADAS